MVACLTAADRVARNAVYGYATDVLSAAIYTYVILPTRWRKLIRDARAQRQQEQRAWEVLAAARYRLAQIAAAQGIQRAFRRRKAQKMWAKRQQCRSIVEMSVWRWLIQIRACRAAVAAATRAHALEEWVHHAVVDVCWKRSEAAQRIQHQWRVHRIRHLHLVKQLEMRVHEFQENRGKINRWIRSRILRQREREQDQRRERERIQRVHQAALCIQTRWCRHHQKSQQRHLVMTAKTALETRDVEEHVLHVDALEPESDLDHELIHRAKMRLEQFLRMCIVKSRLCQSMLIQHQSDQARRVIHHWLWRCIIKRRSEGLCQGPEVDDDPCEESSRGLGNHCVATAGRSAVEAARVVGLSGRIPIRPPRRELSSSVSPSKWEKTRERRAHHAPTPPSSSDEVRCSIKGNLFYSSSSGVTTRPTVLPPLRVPHYSMRSKPPDTQLRLKRAKSAFTDNQAAEQLGKSVKGTSPSHSVFERSDIAAMTTTQGLPLLQRTVSVAGRRLLKRFEPKRERLPTLKATNQSI